MRGRVLGMRQVLKTAPSALFGCGDVVKDRRAIRREMSLRFHACAIRHRGRATLPTVIERWVLLKIPGCDIDGLGEEQ